MKIENHSWYFFLYFDKTKNLIQFLKKISNECLFGIFWMCSIFLQIGLQRVSKIYIE